MPPPVSSFPVAILAGGLATRLRPLTEKIPKLLVEVAGEPFFSHQLRLLKTAGLTRVVLCVGHLGEQIVAQYGDGAKWGMQLEYSFDGPQLLGTGGALIRALPKLGEAFYVLYGDSYLPTDYRAVGDCFQRSGLPGDRPLAAVPVTEALAVNPVQRSAPVPRRRHSQSTGPPCAEPAPRESGSGWRCPPGTHWIGRAW